MELNGLHPVLKRQITKCKFSNQELSNEKLIAFISRVNTEYIDGDQGRYLKERALEISSNEMKEMYETIQYEKVTLESLLNDLTKKDKELKDKNTELTIQRNYATSLLASITDILFVLDKKLTIIDVNEMGVKYLNKEKTEICGMSISELLADIQPIIDLSQNTDKNNAANTFFVNFATEMKTNNDQVIPILLSASLIYNETGEMQNIICTIKDIAILRSLENENAEKMTLLAHAGRLASLGEIATGIAHELNQPLSIIHTNMQTLEMVGPLQLPAHDLEELIASTVRQVNRAVKIINHMRTFARQKKEKPESINLAIPLDNSINMFNEQFRLHQIKMICNYEKDLPNVFAEEREIEQVMVNLLSNARHAVDALSQKMDSAFEMCIIVNLRTINESQAVCFEVIDNGIGMSKDVLERCLDPFFTTKAVGEGTGLGLSIVNSIIKNLHGKMEMESEPGHGTTVRIFIPIGAT